MGKELNTRYHVRNYELIQGWPSFWDELGKYFIYRQASHSRWAICGFELYEAAKKGKTPSWAHRSDSEHLANACGWIETNAGECSVAIIETMVMGICKDGATLLEDRDRV